MNSSALDNLYRTFARYSKPRQIVGCEHCIGEKEIARLLSKPIKELSGDELSSYSSSVFMTVGSVDDFKYFLPRILKLSISAQFSWPDPEIVFKSIKLGEFANWEEVEKNAIEILIDEKIGELIVGNADGYDVDQWICAIENLIDDVAKYLNALEKAENKSAFYNFVENNIRSIQNGKMENGFWENSPDAEKTTIDYLCQSDTVAVYLFSNYGMNV